MLAGFFNTLLVTEERGKLLSLNHLGMKEAGQECFLKLIGYPVSSQLMLQVCVNGFQLTTVKTS